MGRFKYLWKLYTKITDIPTVSLISEPSFFPIKNELFKPMLWNFTYKLRWILGKGEYKFLIKRIDKQRHYQPLKIQEHNPYNGNQRNNVKSASVFFYGKFLKTSSGRNIGDIDLRLFANCRRRKGFFCDMQVVVITDCFFL